MCAVAARADLVSAQKAYAAQDYSRAFELFREIAEIGNVTGQENVAAMYVDGQGVKRDNVLGYAWAVIARENGGNTAMQNIIDQLAPHMNDAARARAAEISEKFGAAALRERLLPKISAATLNPNAGESCRITRPTNPDDYHPSDAKGISGTALVDAMVMPDGRVHHPFVWYSVPEGVFDRAARATALTSGYKPKLVDGVATPCAIRFKIRFRSFDSRSGAAMDSAYAQARPIAQAGDPTAPVIYGLLMFDREQAKAGGETPRDWYLKSAQAGNAYAQYLVGVELLVRDPSASETEKAKGLAWLRMAAAAGQADAKFALANYTLNHEPDALADPQVFALLEDAASTWHRDGTLFLAALLAAGPDAAHRDPKRALELMSKIAPLVDFEPTSFEIRAAAHANLGDFEAAQREQKRALKDARNLGWNVTPLMARLTGYETGQAWSGFLFSEWPAAEGQH
jgi:TonB family protein